MAANKIEVVLSLLDKATAPLAAFNRRVESMVEPFRKVNNQLAIMGKAAGLGHIHDRMGAIGNAASNVASQVSMIGVAGLGAGFLFKKAFVDVAAEFERFETILETIEGSSAKAKQSMNWISEFSAKTPYELTEVTDAFVKLRAYGMEPTKGLLATLGDTAAAMGKPIMQAVEAIADAVTGENERLKEFGIKARKQGDKFVYEYTENGKTIRAAAKANNRAQIQATLETIFNKKYAGAMDKLSKTWGGMMSNVSDQWARFSKMVMESGPFTVLKGRLSDFLASLDRMAESGELKNLAEEWGKRISDGLDRAFEGFKKLRDMLVWFVNFVGGFENAMKIVAAVMAGPLLAAIASLVHAVVMLGVAFAATPFGWIVAGIAAVAAAGVALWVYWDDITKWLADAWAMLGQSADDAWGSIKAAFSSGLAAVSSAVSTAISAIASVFSSAWASINTGTDAAMRALGALLATGMGQMRAAVDGAIQSVKSAFSGMWDGLKTMFAEGVAYLSDMLAKINPVNAIGRAWDWVKGESGNETPAPSGKPRTPMALRALQLGEPVGAAPAAAAAVAPYGTQSITNNAKVEVDFKNVPRGTEVRPAPGNKADVDLSMGYAMQTP